MTTDNVTSANDTLDTATQYISMKDKDGSRSIVELCDLELQSGYSGMTDAEIAKLIKYHEAIAKRDESIALQMKSLQAQQDALNESLKWQEENADAMFAKIINMIPVLTTVTGNEVS